LLKLSLYQFNTGSAAKDSGLASRYPADRRGPIQISHFGSGAKKRWQMFAVLLSRELPSSGIFGGQRNVHSNHSSFLACTIWLVCSRRAAGHFTAVGLLRKSFWVH
jgi:hypothetical protein